MKKTSLIILAVILILGVMTGCGGSEETASGGKTTHVNLYGGEITGNIHGGGLGASDVAADVYGPVTVDVYGGTVNNVFGCNNVNGKEQSTINVFPRPAFNAA